ncbi:MAG TPA: TetR/AcrR family transcriptional regulator [Algoriphagus sp.]|nr:TetR/AcrR family transcriptional regulator [Algoriphagus sp.]
MEIQIVSRAKEHGKKGSLQSWVEEGYSIFSQEGPSSIQVERIARSLNKNKSGFYYFFKDRESYIDSLMQEHLNRLISLTYQIMEIRQFEPEYFNLMIEHREVFFFQLQLVKNRETELFKTTLNQFNNRISAAVIPVWSDYLESSIEVAEKLWGFTRDAIYCRATKDNFGYHWLADLVSEAKLIASFQNSLPVEI